LTSEIQAVDRTVPLCVDLDGTLIRTDLLHETLILLLKANPLFVFMLPIWLLAGRAKLKHEIGKRVQINPKLLPYNVELLDFLNQEHKAGREILLVTASDEDLARPIFEHIGIFSEIVGSNRVRNLKGRVKSDMLVERFGAGKFDYVGDSAADKEVWKNSRNALVVHSSESFLNNVKKKSTVSRSFRENRRPLTLIRAIRVHQWVKNLLLFVPLVMAHQLRDLNLVFDVVLAFIVFSLCSSSVYLINDLLDLEADRSHSAKRKRPLASGEMPIRDGVLVACLLLIASLTGSLLLPINFRIVLGVYFLITLGYSLNFKKIVVLDIIILASLYTIRIFAGGQAVDVAVSQWLLGFSMFMFFSLACIKRFAELLSLRKVEKESLKGRGYRASDLEQIAAFGSASGYISVLVMALYISSEEVTAFYSNPTLIWLICPAILYWISRVWLLAHRDELHEDPIVFALKDKVSYIVGILCALIMWCAS